MANYKVPQNVEAEDKLLGPFSFKQFIYLMIASFGVFMGWLLAKANPWLVVIPAPFVIVFTILGVYHREDQPVEAYFLAALNFFIKPRSRKWNPEGKTENVKIEAPKKMRTPDAKEFEQGRLERLAHIVDTRGWYVKRPELQEPIDNQFIDDDDRLINPAMQTDPDALDVHYTDDMLGNANPEIEDYEGLAQKTHTQAIANAKAKMQSAMNGVQPQPAAAMAAPVTPTAGGPTTNIHYDPYPKNIVQHRLDPTTGGYQQVKNQAQEPSAQQSAPLNAQKAIKELPKDLPVSTVAKVVNRKQGTMTAGKELDIGGGGEVSLRSSRK